MSADDEALNFIARQVIPLPPPTVTVTFRKHTYQLTLLTRAFLHGPDTERPEYDAGVGCAGHGEAVPPVGLFWLQAPGVFVVECAMCRALVGAIRPAADA